MNPKISVVVANFNGGVRLARAVKSVLDQTVKDLEVIVVDDFSTDDSLSGIPTHDSRVKVVTLNQNSGSPAKPRNLGVSESRGDWIAFIDADDIWHVDKLMQQLASASLNGLGACASNANSVDSEGNVKPYFLKHPKKLSVRTLVTRNWVITSSLLVKREILEDCMPFPEIGPAIYEDYAIWLRIASQTDIAFLSSPLLEYSDIPTESFRSKYMKPSVNYQNTFKDFDSWLQLKTGSKAPLSFQLLFRSNLLKTRLAECC
jgi:teichuronic acid biosynthesis glycosyltransferase TuaG